MRGRTEGEGLKLTVLEATGATQLTGKGQRCGPDVLFPKLRSFVYKGIESLFQSLPSVCVCGGGGPACAAAALLPETASLPLFHPSCDLHLVLPTQVVTILSSLWISAHLILMLILTSRYCNGPSLQKNKLRPRR